MENYTLIRYDLLTKDELIANFKDSSANYLVFAAMLAVSSFIGLFFWWKGQKNTEEFLMGGREMGTLPMTLSLVASFMSAITLLGTPAELYVSGTQYCMLVFAYPFVMAAAAHLYFPVFSQVEISTSYSYLQLRFDKSVRLLAAGCFTFQMITYMAIVVYAPALALEQVTGMDVDFACGIIFLVCIFYTSIGGIKAVMWTDSFQALCMFGSFLAIIIKGNYDVGGAGIVFDRNYQSGRVELFNFDTDLRRRHTVWSLIIGGYFTWISIYGINQTQVQRYLTVKKASQAVKAIWLNVIGISGLLMICAYGGMVMFAFYHDCDPVTTKQVYKKDQLFPLFVMQVMKDFPGVPGLFVAGVFSGALSTVSSGLNSLAAVSLRDFVECGMGISLSDYHATILSKLLAVAYGLVGYGFVFVVKSVEGVLEAALGIFGIVGGPVLGVFTLGMFFPFANTKGAFVGTLSSLIFTMWMGFGQTASQLTKHYNGARWSPKMPTSIEHCPASWLTHYNETTATASVAPSESFQHLALYEVSYIWFSAIACVWCLVVGCAVSLLTQPQDPRQIDRRLISPALPRLFAWWPERVFRWIDQYYENIGKDFKEVMPVNRAVEADIKKDDIVKYEKGQANLGYD